MTASAQRKPMVSEDAPPVNGTGNGMPVWLSDLGIQPGEWQYAAKPTYLSLMRPVYPLKVQVWACGMLQTIGYQGELAVKLVKICGVTKRIPFTPADVAKKLHDVACEYYLAAGIEDNGTFWKLKETKQAIRAALAELEEEGMCERKTGEGKPIREMKADQVRQISSGQIRLYFYARPKWGDAEIAKRVHTEALRAYEMCKLRQEMHTPKVAPSVLPHPPILQILKVFSVGRPDRETLKDAGYQERVARAWGSARTVFLANLEQVVIESLPQVAATVLPQGAATPVPEVAPTGRQEVTVSVRESATSRAPASSKIQQVPSTTTTAGPDYSSREEKAPSDVVVVAELLEITERKASEVLESCRQADPDCTTEAIREAAESIFRTLNRNIVNPRAVLMKAIPERLAMLREKRQRVKGAGAL